MAEPLLPQLYSDGHTLPLVIIGTTVAVNYMVFHYASGRDVARRLFGPAADDDAARTRAAFWRRRLGFVLLGLIPLAVLLLGLAGTPGHYGAALPNPVMALLLGLGAWVITVPTVFLGSKQRWFSVCYPEVRHTDWTTRRLVENGLTWGVYLLGYEFFFRGFLLFGLLHSVGYWPAIVLSTGFYAYAHLNKNAGEGLGTLLMGVVYALIALYTGSFLTSFLAHWLTAMTADRLAIGANPAMTRIQAR